MKTNILGKDKKSFDKQLCCNLAISVVLAVVMVVLNVVFSVFRTEENHKVMLAMNIIVDIIIGWILVFFVGYVVLFQNRLKKTYEGGNETVEVAVVFVSEQTERYCGFDCFKVEVNLGDDRVLYLPNAGNMTLTSGERAVLLLSSNVIVEKICEENADE